MLIKTAIGVCKEALIWTCWFRLTGIYCDSSGWLGVTLSKRENPASKTVKSWTSEDQLLLAEESSQAAPASPLGFSFQILPPPSFFFLLSFPHSVFFLLLFLFKLKILTFDLSCVSMSCQSFLTSLRAPGSCHCVVVLLLLMLSL